MLLELRAENYAVIDHAVAEFGPGLNLLTGETGAGKSILVDALALLMGAKSSADLVRYGAGKAVVSAVFESTPASEATLAANGIDADAGGIILRREIHENGKGRVFVNNQPATVAVLRLLAPELALVHAQSETLGSFDGEEQRGLLDRFAGLDANAASVAYAHWRDARSRLDELERGEQDRLRMVDLWRFESREIESAGLAEGEDDLLGAERKVLQNAEKLYGAARSAYEMLYDGSGSSESTLRSALKEIEELSLYDPKFREPVQSLRSALAVVEDVSATTRDFAESAHASPERLAEIEDRLAILDRLKRKYGATVAEIIAFGEDVRRKLSEVENRDELLQGLRGELSAAEKAYREKARALHDQRKQAAGKLAKLAEAEVNDLAMTARFAVAVEADEAYSAWTVHGWDRIEFRISTNAGEPLKPLEAIASGGEMSRVLLAVKVTVEEGAQRADRRGVARPRTLVFDEIDIGIGGRAAEAVGRKLKQLSGSQQVLCVTHLPQIAAFADQHFVVQKQERQGRAMTTVRRMDARERTTEIARMLSGAKLTETSLKHAEQMLKSAR